MELLKKSLTVYRLYDHKDKKYIEFSGKTIFEEVPNTLIQRHLHSEHLELRSFDVTRKEN